MSMLWKRMSARTQQTGYNKLSLMFSWLLTDESHNIQNGSIILTLRIYECSLKRFQIARYANRLN